MEEEKFNIYVDRLKNGGIENISEVFSSDFLQQQDDQLRFESDVSVDGEAYIAEGELVMHLNAAAAALIPCALCNDPVKVPIMLKGLYLVEPLAMIKSGIYNFREPLRESIILEAPRFVKCAGSHCKNESDYAKYLRQQASNGIDPSDSEGEGYRPFANIDFEE